MFWVNSQKMRPILRRAAATKNFFCDPIKDNLDGEDWKIEENLGKRKHQFPTGNYGSLWGAKKKKG